MLNLFIYATFASAGLIVTGELLNDASSQYRLVSIVIQSIGTLSLVFLLPLLFIFISKDDGYNKARWGARRIVFHSLSWLFYALCIFLSICIGLGWWKFISRQSVGSSALVVGCLALISSVFLISSLHEVEATSALKSLATRLNAIRLFFTMNVMLAIIASILAILAERSLINKQNNRLAAIEAVLSAGLFVIVLFNTHGLGGRLMHNDVNPEDGSGKISASPWTFFQPFVGGVKFVILQIISWLFFAFSLVFGFLFILSTFTIGMEIFLGVEAIAGLCCIISEILMIISIHVFEKIEEPSTEVIIAQSERSTKVSEEESNRASVKSYDLSGKEIKQQHWYLKQKLKAVVHDLHALVVTVLVVNMQHLPFLGIVPVFFIPGMSVREIFLHWFAACISIGLYTLAFAYFKARQFSKRRPMSHADHPDGTKEMRQCLVGSHRKEDLNDKTSRSVFASQIGDEKKGNKIRKMKRGGEHGETMIDEESSPSSPSSLPDGSYELVRIGESSDSPEARLVQSKIPHKSEEPDVLSTAIMRKRVGKDVRTDSGNIGVNIQNDKNSKNGICEDSTYDSVSDEDIKTNAAKKFKLSKPMVKVGDDFSSIANIILFCITSVPMAITVYMACTGSRALGSWIVITFFHFWYVGLTYRGAPEITGCREIQEVRRNGPVIRHIGETVRGYFNGSIIKECDLDPKGLYVLGFHPHGIVPITLFWLRCCSDWETLFPGVAFSPLTASVMHLVPLMRDLLQWMGGREVSRESFRHALRGGRSCLVVPGGQAEMLQSQSNDLEIRIITKHSGFVRMALQEGAHLVPILSFGEVDIMDNVRYPVLQQWFLKKIGIAFPHQPYGLFFLPIPRPLKVTVVIGTPIPIQQESAPSEALVKQLMDSYFRALLRMFEKHKIAAGESADRRLVLIESDGKPYKFDDK